MFGKIDPYMFSQFDKKQNKKLHGKHVKAFCVLKADRSEEKHWPSATSKLDFKWTKLYVRFMKWGINEL